MFGSHSPGLITLAFAFTAFCFWLDLHTHDDRKPVSVGSAIIWSVVWTLVAGGFAAYLYYVEGQAHASLFVTGYVLERSLSVDNLFVFMAIFASFGIPERYQHRILYYGILGALLLRVLFLIVGTSSLLLGHWVLAVFGLLVLWSAWQMWRQSGQPAEESPDYSQHWMVRMVGRVLPVEPHPESGRFLVRVQGRWHATPFLLCAAVVQVADLLFAMDSVPAVIAVTRDPFLIFSSNLFAMLGLRSMYFVIAAAKRYLVHLEKAVILILVFIGLRMLATVAGIDELSATTNLAIVLGLLSAGVLASLMFPEAREE